jgi:endoglucanase
MEGSVQILRNFYHRVLAAVRKNDSNHIVFFEGDHFASDFNGLDDFEDPQVAFSFHFYPTVWYPDLYEDTYSREERKSSEKSWTA